MTPRERRAARELRELLVRAFGPETDVSIQAMPVRSNHPDRVDLAVTAVSPPTPTAEPGSLRGERDTPAHGEIVIEICERYVAIRSARYALGGGLIPVTCDQVTEALTRDFRHLFPPGVIEIDVPWQELARAAAETLAGHQVLDDVTTAQLKQKFGELRWYTGGMPDGREAEVNRILDSASYLSSVVCEACGAPGEIRRGGWARVLCDDCAETRRGRR